MIKYYRIPFAAAIVLFGAIQFYGNDANINQSAAQNNSIAEEVEPASNAAEQTSSEADQSTEQSEPTKDNSAQNADSEIKSTSSENQIKQMFGDKSAGGNINSSSKQENIDQIFSALQQAMDDNITSSTAASAAAGAAQQQNLSTLQTLGRMLISLAFVILLGLSLAWFAKGYLLKRKQVSGGLINHLSSYALSQKTKVHLVQIGHEKFLIGEAPNAVSLISKIDSDLADNSQDNFDHTDDFEDGSLTGFNDRLEEWQKALDNQHVSKEVSASLQMLGGLAQRLRKKKGQGYE